ncbi:MAG: ABC transporter permease [Candidatus Eisenbacteria bacterium]|nr:ABC transporter permease [Candidatus Eisenbacteria bacterium]
MAMIRHATRHRLLLLAYLLWVVLLTSVHDLRLLGGALILVGLLSGRAAPRLAWRALRAFVWFNLIVSVSYLLASLWRGDVTWSYLALINLRVAALSLSTFWLAERIDLLAALRFSETLRYLLSIAYGQIFAMRRLLVDFRDALRSRTVGSLRLRDLYRQRAAAAAFLFGRGLRDAGEITLAMRSRGFFDEEHAGRGCA